MGENIVYSGADNAGSSLNDAYSGSFYTAAAGVGLPFNLLSLGFSASIGGDREFDWNPAGSDFQLPRVSASGCKSYCISLSVGVSASPLPGSVTAQGTNYYMSGRRKFNSDQDVVGHMFQNLPLPLAVWAAPFVPSKCKTHHIQ